MLANGLGWNLYPADAGDGGSEERHGCGGADQLRSATRREDERCITCYRRLPYLGDAPLGFFGASCNLSSLTLTYRLKQSHRQKLQMDADSPWDDNLQSLKDSEWSKISSDFMNVCLHSSHSLARLTHNLHAAIGRLPGRNHRRQGSPPTTRIRRRICADWLSLGQRTRSTTRFRLGSS